VFDNLPVLIVIEATILIWYGSLWVCYPYPP